MPKPRDTSPSPAALRMRAYRERRKAKAAEPVTHGPLVAVTVWVPGQDAKAVETFAQRLRHVARIPEREVP